MYKESLLHILISSIISRGNLYLYLYLCVYLFVLYLYLYLYYFNFAHWGLTACVAHRRLLLPNLPPIEINSAISPANFSYRGSKFLKRKEANCPGIKDNFCANSQLLYKSQCMFPYHKICVLALEFCFVLRM